MYKYETHMHTFPVSRCGKSTVEQMLALYKSRGYDGVFVTNHFLDGNVNIDKTLPYEEKLQFYFSDYHLGVELGKEMGLRVFLRGELSYKGTDFLIYGLDEAWYYAHPEIMEMKKSEELAFMQEAGALVIQAHPFREASYIDHIRLYPGQVHGVEVLNACRSEEQNTMARLYADHYGLPHFAGTDIHNAVREKPFAGMASHEPVTDERDFVNKFFRGELEIFQEA